MSYTPLDSGFLTSTLLKEGPDVVSVFALILASADKLGESSLQASVAASLLRISDERAAAAFRVLSEPDTSSRNRANEGRRILRRDDGRWFIVSHQKYQWLASRAAATERQRRYEARQRERENAGHTAATACSIPGCGREAAASAEGRLLCSGHAMREPGEEG